MSGNLKEENKILSYLIANRKWILWVILIVGGLFFLNKRYTSVNGSFKTVDIIILLFWIALLLMPFFQEINFYGLKLKKEIDELKFDVNKQFIDLSRQFINLRSEINNSNDIHSNFTYNFNSTPPNRVPDDQLPKYEKLSKQHLEKEREFWEIKIPANESELTKVPDDVIYLFSVRYKIETELKRIIKETPNYWNIQRTVSKENSNLRKPRRMIPAEIVRILISDGLIDGKLADIIMETYSITNMAVHGDSISDDQLRFVQSIANDLIATLKGIPGRENTITF